MEQPSPLEDLFLAAEQLGVALRSGEGLDRQALQRLYVSLEACAREWAGRDVVPKGAANLFIDLACGIEASSYLYKEAEAEEIRGAADVIADLVRSCLVTDEYGRSRQ